ncbi:MAG: Ig-like domain-containing protein [Bacilli bacterium]|nr:Ig-like domain-containing protein [Bacilli bacterium]
MTMKHVAPLIFLLALSGLSACSSQVIPDVTNITFSRNELTLTKEDTYSLKVTVEGGPKPVVFWSSNEAVATIDKDGLVTARNKGNATLMAICDSKQAFCYLTVNDKPVETEVKLRKGGLKLEFAAPTIGLPSNTFDAPIDFFQETSDDDITFDAKIVMGRTTPEQAYANVQTIRGALAYWSGPKDSVVKAYDDLLAKADADPAKKGEILANESWHFARFDDVAFSALTTVEEGKETGRAIRRINFADNSLLSLLTNMEKANISFKDIYDSNWRGFFDRLTQPDGTYPSEKTKTDSTKYGTLIGDLISAVSTGFTITKGATETSESYTISFPEETRTSLNAWFSKHKDTLHLINVPSLDKLDVVLTFGKTSDAFLGFVVDSAYHVGETANAIKVTYTLAESSEPAPKDTLQNLHEASKLW